MKTSFVKQTNTQGLTNNQEKNSLSLGKKPTDRSQSTSRKFHEKNKRTKPQQIDCRGFYFLNFIDFLNRKEYLKQIKNRAAFSIVFDDRRKYSPSIQGST